MVNGLIPLLVHFAMVLVLRDTKEHPLVIVQPVVSGLLLRMLVASSQLALQRVTGQKLLVITWAASSVLRI